MGPKELDGYLNRVFEHLVPFFPRMLLQAPSWTMAVCVKSFASFTSLDTMTTLVLLKVAECIFAPVKCFISGKPWMKWRDEAGIPPLNYWTLRWFVLRSFFFLPWMTCGGCDKNTKPVKRNLLQHQDACVCCLLVHGIADYFVLLESCFCASLVTQRWGHSVH